MWVAVIFLFLLAAASCSCELSSVYYIGQHYAFCLGMAVAQMATLVQLFLFVYEIHLT